MLVRLLYTLLLALAAPLLLFGLYRSKPNKPKFGQRWKEHFGITPKLIGQNQPLWIHAVSVGESLAAIPLIKAIKEKTPDQVIVVTTTTSTGAEQIAKLGNLVEHRYMPIDFAFAVRGFLKAINPAKMLIIETELWPNTLATVHKANIPVIVVNARLSEKSQQNYAKVQPLFNLIHPCLSKVLCQSQADADRFTQLGVPTNKLCVTGSIKFDIHISDEIKHQGAELRTLLGQQRPVWIAASTHKGEDEQVLDAHRQVLETHPNALLILVPRHPERFDSVFELCQTQGFETVRRTQANTIADSTQVYLGDTMGEMLILLGAADVCFMGGSLVGDKVGGHNVLEPAALGIPMIIGPSYYNFKDIVDRLLVDNNIEVANDYKCITLSLEKYFSDERLALAEKQKLLSFVNINSGSLSNTVTEFNLYNLNSGKPNINTQ
ncbi:lipid IV(A) 3-deoxy-D-manno-octulosonic acid transferase [Vibrio vulnificus]|uniref:lipid IV(A) 3-deoxy-D-manno-octulosonic acid transferase n=1 Tax=Vibrio vulnificus TaxID=672 RepID=UPI0019D49F46|nr:lipid IV(A) 3-deoxy-D-manno-octulosonic acid transferase [Vibrio vulnificus]ELE1962573.1 lipid IV(A) 3-deoxy-D-manno-octulosonic acid transferase [Vibrio vulnificus]ELL0597537.1 lipid IV(A) 3-deoxy-D-manno-octulosonic acid transferase [Vibrio vulnificus]MBN8085952.1 lipid IV(A) 3-deoxy-D-manno-octulosonic acid transferase [Vibrio vulnificus]MBN8129026.1 lipid IV(A) 3-deoxy-D-manno-octulosonic acid transferase [Vibrio vulnificus]MBN8133472.1 lipid IV(A) 3-deoxy-D-manno-octulosonic acid trans